MPKDAAHPSNEQNPAQQRFLSLFLRSEREIFGYVAALVPNIADVEDRRAELHVFKGSVDLQAASAATNRNFLEGSGVVLETAHAPRLIAPNERSFAPLFDLQARSFAAETRRLDELRDSGRMSQCPRLI